MRIFYIMFFCNKIFSSHFFYLLLNFILYIIIIIIIIIYYIMIYDINSLSISSSTPEQIHLSLGRKYE